MQQSRGRRDPNSQIILIKADLIVFTNKIKYVYENPVPIIKKNIDPPTRT
jgi:hypothetical protein